jgi:hypothetical protein
LAVFIAFAVMSGFTINAYRLTYNFQGSGIYSNTNTFSLNSNTVILFAFCLGAAFITSAIYFWMARIFTKVPNPPKVSLILGIHLDHRDTSLFTWIWYCDRLLHSRILFRRNYFRCFCGDIHLILLFLAKTDPLLNSDVTIYDGRHEEISLHNHGQCSWIVGISCFWSVVDSQLGQCIC